MLDFTNDNLNKGLSFLKDKLTVPSFVKDESVEKYASLPKTAFADAENRLYPIDDASNTWKSIAYFLTDGSKQYADQEKVASVHEALGLASTLHNINNEVADIYVALQLEQHKVASEAQSEDITKNYAFVDGKKLAYDISTPQALIKSAKNITEDENLFESPIAFKVACDRIYNKACEMSMQDALTNRIMEVSEPRITDSETLKTAMAKRVAFAEDEETKSLYADIAQAGLDNPNEQLKIASLICDIDKHCGYVPSSKEDTALGCVYSGINKEAFAKEVSQCVLIKEAHDSFKNEDFDIVTTLSDIKERLPEIEKEISREKFASTALKYIKDNLEDADTLSYEISRMPKAIKTKIARVVSKD